MDHPDFWYLLFLWWLTVTVPICAVIWLAWAVWTWVTRRRQMTVTSLESLDSTERQESGLPYRVRRRSFRVPLMLTVLVGGLSLLGLFKPYYDWYSDWHDWDLEGGLLAWMAMDSDYKLVGVTDSFNGGSVRLAPWGQLTIMLDSDPSTGCSWHAGEIAGPGLYLTGEPTFARPVAGEPGRQSFTFVATGVGMPTPGTAATVQLVLEYRRDSEPNAPPEKTFNLTVNIY